MMKTKYILILFLILVVLNTMSQKTIEYDFHSKTMTIDHAVLDMGKQTLKFNTSYILSIKNINTRLYHHFTVNAEQNNLFKDVTITDFNFLEVKDNDTEVVTGIQSNLDKEVSDLSNDITKILAEIDPQMVNNLQSKEDKTAFEGKLRNMILIYPEIESDAESLFLLEYFNSGFDILANHADNVKIAFYKIENLKEYYNELVNLSKEYGLTKEKSLRRLEELGEIYQDQLTNKHILWADFEDQVSQFSNNFASFQEDSKIQKIYKTSPNLEVSVIELKEYIESLNTYQNEFDKDNKYRKMIKDIQDISYQLRNTIIQTIYFAEEIIPQKDILILNIEYFEKDLNNYDQKGIKHNFKKTFNVKGGFRLAFSTGLMLGMNLHDRKYTVSPAEGMEGYSVITKNTNYNYFQPGVGALGHLFYRSASSFTGGFSFGLGSNLSTVSSITVYLGGSMAFGREERAIISFGFAAAPVDYLNDDYVVGTPIKDSEFSLEKLTNPTFRPGFFFGVTYNLITQKSETL